MKTYLLAIGMVLLAPAILRADDAQSFATGFAQGLNNAIQSQHGYYPQQYNEEGMSRQQLEQWWLTQQQMLLNQQRQLYLQQRQLQEQQEQKAWYNRK